MTPSRSASASVHAYGRKSGETEEWQRSAGRTRRPSRDAVVSGSGASMPPRSLKSLSSGTGSVAYSGEGLRISVKLFALSGLLYYRQHRFQL